MIHEREHWETIRAAWSRALGNVSRGLPDEAPLKKAMGTIAWGRYDGEPCASDSKDNVIFGAGFLAGARYVLLAAARANDWEGESAVAHVAGEADKEIRKAALKNAEEM